MSGGAGQAAEPDEQNLGSLGDAGHTFDQTNGLVDGLQGNSNGFAEDNDEGDGTDGGDDSAVPLISPESQ
ncbi:hypothetical protein EEJ31_07830 [Cryobacterium tepidiphilum]|uniref:Uncharacterized protein n=1 Tax=Cryobacterium tepidiphilum TaxID=2486026 RepID=A0A3M8LAP3_9MICO|nr:hypothetical protein EEJ31_07830 [Cryobacterium tepidiphilum]